MEDQLSFPRLLLEVAHNSVGLFTTVLQSGIEIKTSYGETLAGFLSAFPGFTADYLANTVQTIFLDGTAVDDLSLKLTGSNPVLALSAAMPGLAGAIFRKNSFHSALRTDTHSSEDATDRQEYITVTLKLFNSIALERGAELLKTGKTLDAKHLLTFLNIRDHLEQYIKRIELEGEEIDYQELLNRLQTFGKIDLSLSSKQ